MSSDSQPMPDPGPDPTHVRIVLPPNTYEIKGTAEGTVVVIRPAQLRPQVHLVFHDPGVAITFAKDVLDAAGVTGYGD